MSDDNLFFEEDLAFHRALVEAKEQVTMDKTTERIEHLAAAARPIDDNDYGSEAQILAENAFFDVLETVLPETLYMDTLNKLATAKATTDEMIDDALKVWRDHKTMQDEDARQRAAQFVPELNK